MWKAVWRRPAAAEVQRVSREREFTRGKDLVSKFSQRVFSEAIRFINGLIRHISRMESKRKATHFPAPNIGGERQRWRGRGK